MSYRTTSRGATRLTVAVCALLVVGCSQMSNIRIDPSGERCFIIEERSPIVYTQPPPGMRPAEPTSPPVLPPTMPMAAPPAQPLPEAQPKGSNCLEDLKKHLHCPEKVDKRLTLSPARTIAPVGSEVVLLAGVAGSDGYLYTNQRIEWMLAPDGAGEIVEFDKGSWSDPFVGDFTRAKKVDNGYAVSTTSRTKRRLTRGTEDKSDDVSVLKGQTWATVTSATEGTSWLTAVAPKLGTWEDRQQTCAIYWVDAQWLFPSPCITTAGGSSALTTTVSRQTNSTPQANWIVRYEITGGPAAQFAPSGTQVAEVPTDAEGRATVHILQQTPMPGTNSIAIQVIRPTGLGQPSERLVLGSGCVQQTWSAASLTVETTGPKTVALGEATTFQIRVRNGGDMSASDVMVRHDIPSGMTFVGSNPTGQPVGQSVQWQLGSLGGGQTTTIDISLRPDQGDSYSICANASATGGLSADHCWLAEATKTQVEFKVFGPSQAEMNKTFEHTIQVTNRGATAVDGLVIIDTFDEGLVFVDKDTGMEKVGAIRYPFDEPLAAGEMKEVGIMFRVTKSGELCHTIEITGPGGFKVDRPFCVTVPQPASPSDVPAPPGGGANDRIPLGGERPPVEQAGLVVEIVGPESGLVGETIEFTVRIRSQGSQPLQGVHLACTLDPAVFDQVKDSLGRNIAIENGTFSPDIGILNAGQPDLFTFQARCIQASSSTRLHATVTTDQAASGEDTKVVRIEENPNQPLSKPGLTMSITSLSQPIRVGEEVTFLVDVENEQMLPDSNLRLEVLIPPGMLVDPLGTHYPTLTTPEERDGPDGKILQFDPIPRIEANAKIKPYRIRLRALERGTFDVKAILTSDNMTEPRVDEATITVY